jgi:rhodanese-related sulfurtransferase
MHKVISCILVFTLGLGLAVPALAAKEVPLVNKQTLKSWLNDPDLLIIDVRLGSYDSSKKKIKGSVRKDPYNVRPWAATLPKNKKIVLYCS